MKLKQLVKLTEIEIKLFLREPAAFFFTLIFPVMLLLILGAAFGGHPVFAGLRVIDFQVPGLIAMVIATVGLMSIPIVIAEYKEKGVFKRLKATPLHPTFILAAQIIVSFLMVSISSLLLIGVAYLVFNIKFQVDILSFLITFSLSCVAFFSLGFMLSGLFRTARAVQAAGMFLFFPMLFLSGAAIPKEVFPEILQKIAPFIPLTHVVDTLTEAWIGNSLVDYMISVIILLIIMVFCIFVSIRTFRWE